MKQPVKVNIIKSMRRGSLSSVLGSLILIGSYTYIQKSRRHPGKDVCSSLTHFLILTSQKICHIIRSECSTKQMHWHIEDILYSNSVCALTKSQSHSSLRPTHPSGSKRPSFCKFIRAYSNKECESTLWDCYLNTRTNNLISSWFPAVLTTKSRL